MIMNKVPQEIDDQLLDYLDGRLGPRTKEIESMLGNNPAVRARLEELKVVHGHLAHQNIQEPSTGFTKRVMDNLRKYPYSQGLRMRNTLLLLLGVLVASGIGVVLLSGGVFDNFTGEISPNTIPLGPNIQKSIPVIPLNGKLIVNILIFLNLGLAFLILDRGILRPWFEKRRLGY